MTMALGAQVGLGAASLMLGEEGGVKKDLILSALGLGAQIGAILPFSRANESEADEFGLRFMAVAGYDPREAPRFWDRFSHTGSGAPPTFLSTHPASSDRKSALAQQLPKVLPYYERSPKYGVGENF